MLGLFDALRNEDRAMLTEWTDNSVFRQLLNSIKQLFWN